jgi:hypothetical protein
MVKIHKHSSGGSRANALWGTGKTGEQRSALARRTLVVSLLLALALVFPVAAGADSGSDADYCWDSSCLDSLYETDNSGSGSDSSGSGSTDSGSLDDAAWYDASLDDAAWYDASFDDAAWADAAWGD